MYIKECKSVSFLPQNQYEVQPQRGDNSVFYKLETHPLKYSWF